MSRKNQNPPGPDAVSSAAPAAKKGRPVGSPNVGVVVDVQPSACTACGSTEKEYTGSKTVQDVVGLLGAPTGAGRHEQAYNQIVRRRCVCSGCGQTRIERSFEFDPEKK